MSIVTGVSARACPSRSGVRGERRGRAEQFYRREGGVNRRVTTHESLVHGLVWIDSTDTNEIRVTIGERVGVFFTTSTSTCGQTVWYLPPNRILPRCWQCNVVVGLLDRTFGGHSDIRRTFGHSERFLSCSLHRIE